MNPETAQPQAQEAGQHPSELELSAMLMSPATTAQIANKLSRGVETIETALITSDKLHPPEKKGELWMLSEAGRQYLESEGLKPKKGEGQAAAAPAYSPEVVEQAHENFASPALMHKIYIELNRGHVGDDSEKTLAFLCACTAMMPPKYRVSFRLSGSPAGGKDNLITAVLSHMPKEVFAIYDGTTDKFLLRLVDSKPGLYAGELNLQRQGGANQNIIEVLKAAAEGGVTYGYLEGDGKGKYLPMENKIERKVIIISGAEVTQDDELASRLLTIGVSETQQQTKDVLWKQAEDDETEDLTEGTSWIACGLAGHDRDISVIIPVPIKKALAARADTENLRARRDFKRLLSIIRASAWLHQRQRPQDEARRVVAIPADVYHAFRALGDTLNQSYTSAEPRVLRVIECIRKLGGDEGYVPIKSIVKAARITGKNRQADIFRTLRDQLMVETRQNPDDRRSYDVKLTGKVGTFIWGNPKEIFQALPPYPPEKNSTYPENQHQEANKLVYDRLNLVSDRFNPLAPVIDFQNGAEIPRIGLENQNQQQEPSKEGGESTYLNLSKPNFKPISKPIYNEKQYRFNDIGGDISKNPQNPTILDTILEALRNSKDKGGMPFADIAAAIWAKDPFIADDTIGEWLKKLKTEGMIFQPTLGGYKLVK